MKSSRDNIVSVAIKVFGRLGLDKTTMNDIAVAANKGRRTIYQYFRNKEEIYDAAIDRETKILLKGLEEIVNNDLSVKEKLEAYLFERMKSIFNLSLSYQAFKIGLIQKSKAIQNLRIKFDQSDYQYLQQILKEGIDQEDFVIDNIEMTARNILTSLKGMEITFIRKGFNEKCVLQLKNFIDILFNGISKA